MYTHSIISAPKLVSTGVELDRQALLTPDAIINNSASVGFDSVSRSRVEHCHKYVVNKDGQNKEADLLSFIT